MAARTYRGAVREFEKASPWLGPEHSPALVTIRNVAEQLDAEGLQATPALIAQFGLAYRNLLKEAPGRAATATDEDPVDALIREARS